MLSASNSTVSRSSGEFCQEASSEAFFFFSVLPLSKFVATLDQLYVVQMCLQGRRDFFSGLMDLSVIAGIKLNVKMQK